jgi:tetratricopeptide (TPR) repeat protein
LRALALCLLLVALPAGASEEFARFITAASRLFENLEYERALEQLSNAKKFASTPDEQTQVALYEGVVLIELGRTEEAKAAFETALFLSPDAQIPVKVSPKVKAQIEAVRAQVKKELAPILAKKEAEEKAKREAEEKAKKEAEAKAKKEADAKKLAEQQQQPQPKQEEPEPKKEIVVENKLEPQPPVKDEHPIVIEQPPPETPRKRGVPIGTIIFGAAGIGTVITAGIFGGGSQSAIQQGMSAMWQSDAAMFRQQAMDKALVANVLFAVSGALLVATIIATAIWAAGP